MQLFGVEDETQLDRLEIDFTYYYDSNVINMLNPLFDDIAEKVASP